MDISFLPFTPNFSAEHYVIIPKPLSEVFEKLGTASAHAEVCRLSSLCTAINLKEKDTVALASGKSIENSDFLRTPASSPEELEAASKVAYRQHFNLEETIPVVFGLIKSKVTIRGTLTWTQPEALALESGGPVYAVYESEVIGGLAIRIYRLRKLEAAEAGESSATKVTEFLYGVGPSYLNFLIAKEAVVKHRYRVFHLQEASATNCCFRERAHIQRLPELFQ